MKEYGIRENTLTLFQWYKGAEMGESNRGPFDLDYAYDTLLGEIEIQRENVLAATNRRANQAMQNALIFYDKEMRELEDAQND